ncbi:hypothetical protein EJ04DRAFT_126385 [Polyplosphaeria fusca]|uniref:Uncharacterized protein n=1 Tax=Polyplosphaeria fusca TaxID=682080 RepID=A0A9P4R626_9PLEO|nr:hypothetical protein EJ04DRAFT_126385 [Polyplosphaeria fusca]
MSNRRETFHANVGAVTRSHKHNDRDHAGLADGTAEPEEHLPRYFAKSGHSGEEPNKVKKNGGGKGNWGLPGDEIDDLNYTMANPRRRSNSSTHQIKDFKTKFEAVEQEPVFEEELHGATAADLEKQSTASTSNSSASIEEEDVENKKL